MALITLLELADLSIGTPEIGVVNFNALHTLLHAIIKQLNLQDVKAEMHDEKPMPPEPAPLQEKERRGKCDESEDLPYADLEKKVIGVAAQVHGVEAKVIGVETQVHGVKSQIHGIGEQVQGLEKQMAALEKLPSGTDLLERTKSGSPNGSAVADMWQMMQMKKKIEANETGISKAMALFQDLLNEVNGVKAANFHMNEGLENIKEKLDLNLQLDTQEIGNRLQTCIADQKNLDNDVRNLERRINLYPSPEEMYSMVRWEVLEDCLVTGKGKSPPTEAQSVDPSLGQPSPAEQPASVMDTQARKPAAPWAGAPGSQPGSPSSRPGIPGMQAGTRADMPAVQPAARAGTPGTRAGTPEAQAITPTAQPGSPGAQPGAQPGSPGAQPGFPGAQPGFPGAQAGAQPGFPGAQAGAPGIQPSFPGTWPSSPVTQVGPPRVWHGAPGAQAGYLGTPADTSAFQPTSPTAGPSALAAQLAIPPGPYSAVTSPASPLQEKDKHLTSSTPQGSSGSSSASSRYSDTVEALRRVGQLTDLYTALQEQINHLEQFKCSHADLDKLQQFLLDAVPKNLSSMPADLMDQLSSLKATAEDMKDVKAKVRKLQNVLEAEVETEADQKVKGSSQINLQLGYLRSTVHDIEKELQELREQQDHGKAKLEQSVTDTALYLQEQLDKLRSIIETMMTSSSTLLSMSMPTSPEPGEAAPNGTCPACSLDVSEQVSQLFKRYEQLQDLISSFMTRHTESKPAKRPQLRSQDEELLSRIQNTILQVQGDCENLNATTGNLIEDHRQKQKDIALLFQSLEKLEKEKADKEHLETEIDVKADKMALAGKVSRSQFDATTEQLNKMMQDLVNKMSGQEQDWHKVLDKILVEMDSKLDRLELDPFRQQLEERWKAIRKQLKERSPQYAADDAAGIRKRLMAHFHCISCDRPLEMVVPGPTIMTIPSVPGLPSHRSIRPYTVYELEQVRQHTRSLKLGLRPYPRLDALQLEKSAGLGKLRSIHSKMLMDIEKVQIHFGGSAKASSQMIREIMQSQCLSPGQYNKRDKMAEMAEYGYLSMPRRCGGSHTLTYPYRRYTRLQQIAQCMPMHPEETAMLTVMKREEVDILGLDGHIYKGRMDTRLPSISAKDGPLKSKPKISRSSSQRQPALMDTAGLPARPHSAKLSSPSNSGTARSLKDRPVSSEGRLSRVDLTHLSTSTPPPEEGREDSPMQEKETLELQLDLSMRRRSAEQPAPLQ
ncbi:glutamine-rich protein 2 isoform X2 [Gopherus flavomarginatus]|uniref:glutamine-rich protein 2 isoform X2 n=1 Tax=Gopherus flavomarginatus TaxID=286002 RepID=UPI0021CBB85C|nr:glutamine-rich protein 2 isoform X2 [Gopherus flavomarginatus]